MSYSQFCLVYGFSRTSSSATLPTRSGLRKIDRAADGEPRLDRDPTWAAYARLFLAWWDFWAVEVAHLAINTCLDGLVYKQADLRSSPRILLLDVNFQRTPSFTEREPSPDQGVLHNY